MDGTEDAELHKRYVEWKEEVELRVRIITLKNLPESEFKYEVASADAILEALED